MTEKNKEELLIRIDENVKHHKEQLELLWVKLDTQGDVRKDLDAHIGSHWKWVAIIISITITLVAVAGIIIKLS